MGLGGVFFWWLLLASPFVGSFLGVLVERLPSGRPVLFARSACDHCGQLLKPLDLVPFLSWTLTKGRCRYCGAPIGIFTPLIELAAMLVVVWAALVVSGPVLIATCVLGWILLTLAIIDWNRLVLPDVLCLVLGTAGVVACLLLMPDQIAAHAIGAVAGFLFFFLLGWSYRILRGRVGLGLGDAKLMAGIGLWLGWQAIPTVILFASVAGLLVAVGQSIGGRTLARSSRLPLGSFLAIAAWITWLYGPLMPRYS
jgi:leader peptidase (prepilin peptidase)/N-methyltransferase